MNDFELPPNIRTIIHLDLDAFFCAVEELRTPSLKGKAFAVGGQPDQRGVVSSCSYAARQFGVRSAMPMSRALRFCPNLLVISPHFQDYRAASKEVMARILALTDRVEQISIDEAFFDATLLPEGGEVVARRLQREIIKDLHLPCSLGVASNKLVAKIATDVGKKSRRSPEPPCAITIVPAGEEERFLAPLAVDMLWGVGPKTSARLEEMGVKTIGDLAAKPVSELARRFGKNGSDLARRARGIDNRPIITEYPPKSFSEEITFARDISQGTELQRHIQEMADQVARRLRSHQVQGSTIRLKLRWPDFTTLTRQVTLDQPTDQPELIATQALKLFDNLWTRGRAVRLLGVGVSHLSSTQIPPPSGANELQPGFWDAQFHPLVQNERDRKLDELIEQLEQKFGRRLVKRGIK